MACAWLHIEFNSNSERIVVGFGPENVRNSKFFRLIVALRYIEHVKRQGSMAVNSTISIKYEINRIRSLANLKWNYIFEWNKGKTFFIHRIKSHLSAMVAAAVARDREETFKWNYCGDYRNVCTIIQYFSFQLVWPETRSHLRHLRAYFHNARCHSRSPRSPYGVLSVTQLIIYIYTTLASSFATHRPLVHNPHSVAVQRIRRLIIVNYFGFAVLTVYASVCSLNNKRKAEK